MRPIRFVQFYLKLLGRTFLARLSNAPFRGSQATDRIARRAHDAATN
jgi:hypothetical protein